MKFTLYFFISTLSSMLGLGYVLTFIPPSKTCGPFPHQDTPLLNYVSECFSDLPFTLQRALSFLVRSDVLSLGIMMLLLINYIFYIKLKSHERMAGNLKSQLVLQGQDKKYLTSRINHLVAKSGRGSKNAKNTKKPKDQHPLE
ncbi:Transmembrane channellike protein 7like [Caligus rogercresseyi]|uniref:Transmembrane channellike protein 7like n=1 Tax=Caligus rogercresseyi TaxID=217165 RepID=A0A7T8JUQ9_CALRO|nr:Transmembrane channellike protein 7like [Caligus rogercresseyi]